MERTARQGEATGAGYLCFQSAGADGEAWAALLVINAGGLPIEFLYSGPLRPTAVQSILYQERLGSEVRLSLVRSLLKGLRSRLVFVAVAADETDGVGELPCPLLVLEGETGTWTASAPPPAEALRRRIEETVGQAEPLGRARAALAYVVEYERSPEQQK